MDPNIDVIDEPHFKFNRGTMKLSPDFSRTSDNDSSASFESWNNYTNGINEPEVYIDERSRSNSGKKSELHFQIFSTKIITEDDASKKYVTYCIRVKKDEDNIEPCIERRYTDFLELFTNLKLQHPNIMASVNFPRKIIVGNFSPESIMSRSVAFESFLNYIVANERLKQSNHTTSFFQNKELKAAKDYINSKQQSLAIPVLENLFRLLNKIYTDRHPAVLRCLCFLVACSHAASFSQTEKFAALAVKRFMAVSDTDLLQYFVPLLQLCLQLDWTGSEPNHKSFIEDYLKDMKRRGIKVDSCLPLLQLLQEHYS